MDKDTATRLDQLETFVGTYKRDELDPTDFWDGFFALAGPLDQLAFADDADEELRERYCAILACADESGFMVPP